MFWHDVYRKAGRRLRYQKPAKSGALGTVYVVRSATTVAEGHDIYLAEAACEEHQVGMLRERGGASDLEMDDEMWAA